MAQLFLLMRGWQRWGVVATLAAAACTRPQLHPHRHADGEATLHPAPDGPQPEPIDEPLRALKAPTQYVGLGMAYGGDGRMRASELAMLPDGSTLVVGSFSMPVHFDSGTLPLEPKGPRDGFVMKLDSERRILAARSFGGPGRDGLFRVAPWGDGALAAGERQAAQGRRAVALRLDLHGQTVWEHQVEGPVATSPQAVFTHGPHAAVLAVEYRSLNRDQKTKPAHRCRVEVLRSTGQLEHQWTLQGDGSCLCQGGTFAGDDLVVVGATAGRVDFAPGQSEHWVDTGEGRHAFVARYSRSGELRWVRTVPSDVNAEAWDVVATEKHVVVHGVWQGGLMLNDRQSPLGTGGRLSLWVSRWSHQGEMQKLATFRGSAGTSSAVSGSRMTAGPAGTIWFGGSFEGEVDFGQGHVRTTPRPTGYVVSLNRSLEVEHFASWEAGGARSYVHELGIGLDHRVRVLGDFTGGKLLLEQGALEAGRWLTGFVLDQP